MHPTQFSFGDNVEVCNVVTTRDLALAGLKGAVFGVTTPSVTGVEVIGTLIADVAINISFPSLDKDFWFAPELLEFLDHGAGTVITIGTHNKTLTAVVEVLVVSSSNQRFEFSVRPRSYAP